MFEFGVNVKGIPEMRKTLREMPAEMEEKVVGAGSVAMGRVAARTARGIVQVKTGALKRTIRVRKGVVRTNDGKRTKGAKVVAGGPGVIYAPFIEFGRPGAKEFPYIRPAMHRHQEEQMSEFGKASGKAMQRIKGTKGRRG